MFDKFSGWVAKQAGRPSTFLIAVAIILIWACTGPILGFSETWQLVINTGTTIITFLMVFLIQNSQNRDSLATHVKLDELLCSIEKARNELIDIEEKTEKEIDEERRKFRVQQ